MEIVPVESVVGIFEIKRSLNETSLLGRGKTSKGAFEHLSDIIESVSVTKNSTQRFAVGGAEFGNSILGGCCSNPIIGIIGLTHVSSIFKTGEDFTKIIQKAEENLETKAKQFPEIDIIFSLNGMIVQIGKEESDKVIIANPRSAEEKYIWKLNNSDSDSKITKTKIFAFSLGYILGYLQTTCGRYMKIENYFFNESIL